MRGIGRLARESGLTVSALRFYDGAGVLVPAHADPLAPLALRDPRRPGDVYLLMPIRLP